MDSGPGTWDSVWQAAVLGLVQGVTEFLPISSTAHLILVPALFGWEDSLLTRLEFDVALHIGTLAALLGVFWRDWAGLVRAGTRSLRHPSLADPQARLAWLIVLATVPAGAAGLAFERQVETVLRSPAIVGYAMVTVGFLLAVADRVGARRRDEYTLGPIAALAVGVGQALALIPGVSRSGGTMAVGLATGLTRAAAARFSFLLSAPIVVAAIAAESVDVIQRGLNHAEGPAFAVGICVAALSGYISIRWLLFYLQTGSLLPFVVYRVIAGSAVITLAATGHLA